MTEEAAVATEEVVDTNQKQKTAKSKTEAKNDKTVYYKDAKVVCACGNTFTTGSTKPEIRVEICNSCHPFFTGQEKFVDTEGRVERFKRMEAAKQEPKTKKEFEKRAERPKSLKEMLLSLEK